MTFEEYDEMKEKLAREGEAMREEHRRRQIATVESVNHQTGTITFAHLQEAAERAVQSQPRNRPQAAYNNMFDARGTTSNRWASSQQMQRMSRTEEVVRAREEREREILRQQREIMAEREAIARRQMHQESYLPNQTRLWDDPRELLDRHYNQRMEEIQRRLHGTPDPSSEFLEEVDGKLSFRGFAIRADSYVNESYLYLVTRNSSIRQEMYHVAVPGTFGGRLARYNVIECIHQGYDEFMRSRGSLFYADGDEMIVIVMSPVAYKHLLEAIKYFREVFPRGPGPEREIYSDQMDVAMDELAKELGA